MAVYSLLFGHTEWPEEKPPFDPVAALDLRDLERKARLSVTVPERLKRRVEASAELEGVAPDAWIERALSRSVDPRLLQVTR
jgi:hypothetical protein